MKKISLSIAALAVVLAVTFTSCKKDDTGLPVVSLTGDGTITLDLGATWTDPGATATDDNDGTITPVVTGTVNTDKVGEYTVTYTATDEAGNVGTATRTVRVKADKLAALYDVVETYEDGSTSSCSSTVAAGSAYNKITITNFGGYGASRVFDATVSSTGIALSDLTFTNDQDNQVTQGTGTYSKVSVNYNIISFTYTWKHKATTASTWTTETVTQTYTRH